MVRSDWTEEETDLWLNRGLCASHRSMEASGNHSCTLSKVLKYCFYFVKERKELPTKFPWLLSNCYKVILLITRLGPVHLFDDSPPLRFSPPNLNRHSSAETVATDPWMRPGTSDTLRSLGRPFKRERAAT